MTTETLTTTQEALGARAARNLATTTKTAPQMVGIAPRWFLKLLAWVPLDAAIYRVNRVKVLMRDGEKIRIDLDGGSARIEARHLRSLPLLRELDETLIESLTKKFTKEQHDQGKTIVKEGKSGNKFYIVARGKVEVSITGRHGQKVRLAVLGEGDYFGEMALIEESLRTATIETLTPSLFFTLDMAQFQTLMSKAPGVRERLESIISRRHKEKELVGNEHGEKLIHVASNIAGEAVLPETFVDYEEAPREYSLSAVQSIVRTHTRVTDLYNHPIDQLREQLRLTSERIKEAQEWEMVNNKEFGLLNVAAPSMRIQTRSGPPTPDDLDELLARVWKKPSFFLAHPKAIAAFGRECTRRGVPPPTVEMFGSPFLTWRGVPLVPTDKLEVNSWSASDKTAGTTSILLVRVGEKEQGVVGLCKKGNPGESLPALSVRFMGIDVKAISSYLITLYFSIAVLTDDALGVLENVDVSSYHDYR